jgi:hypothetical protein
MLVSAHISILNDVFGFQIVRDDRTRYPEEPPVITPHQNFKERRLAFDNPAHHFLIA